MPPFDAYLRDVEDQLSHLLGFADLAAFRAAVADLPDAQIALRLYHIEVAARHLRQALPDQITIVMGNITNSVTMRIIEPDDAKPDDTNTDDGTV